jgi:predicted NBD/HSP70 family sugar kinase
MRFTQPTAARQLNRLRILNLIATHEHLSRADVSRLLGLNKVSTGEIVDLLLGEGILTEEGSRTTNAGRRPINLALNREYRMVIAIDIGTRNTSVALVNLAGEMLRYERFPTANQPTAEEMAATIIQSTKKVLARMKDPSIVCGLSISLNGEVEPATGTVLHVPDWNWHSVPLSYALSKHLPFPVLVENNVRSMVFGERWFAGIDPKTTYFYVNWGEHIGSAWLTGESLVSQDSQFGHIPIAQSGTCRCGAIGCLETQAAGWALVEGNSKANSVKQLASLAETDSIAETELLHATESLAHGLIYAAAMLRPDKIIIGGGISALPDRYFHALNSAFKQKSSPMISSRTTIERSQLGDRAGILGTAAVGLDEFIFKRSLLDKLRTK